MVKPKKEDIEKLKRQDKELKRLPDLKKEEKVFKEKESYLTRNLRPTCRGLHDDDR